MAEAKLDFRIVDRKVFTVTFVFGVVAGFETPFNIYLHVVLLRSVGPAAFGTMNLLLSGLYYVFNPVLFFVVLYLYCGGPLLNRMTRILISLVFGGMLGYWVGYLAGGAVSVVIAEQPAYGVYSNLPFLLPQYVIGQLLTSFGILALSDLVPKWRESVKVPEGQGRIPGGLVVIVAVYAIFAVLNALAIPLLAIYVLSEGSMAFESLAAILLVATLFLSVVGQLILAVGLYHGRIWAWILAVVSSATGVLIDISAVGILLLSGLRMSVGLTLTITGLFAGFLISLAILLYLMTASVRQFFRFVNRIE